MARSLPNRQRRGRQAAGIAAAATALLALAGAGIAQAGAGGSSVGSVGAPETPKVRNSICLTSCVGLHKAVVGSTVQLIGKNMAAVSAVSFPSTRDGERVDAPVIAATPTSAQAVVPAGVRNGALIATDLYGQASKPAKEPLLIRPKRVLRVSGPLNLVDAEVFPNKVFYGTRSARLNYVVSSGQPSNDLRVDVVSPSGQVVQSFFPADVTPNTTQSLAWNGAGFDGKPVADGWYAFRISTPDGAPVARRAKTSDALDLGVAVYSYIFPVRGPHDFGGAGARFGASRSGHTHQGQDVMAPCGTKLVAARGGTVQYNGYQGSAGNYLVIDLKGSPEDMAYMHLAAPSPIPVGGKVGTGQYIGNVGDTGNAEGCHLHFEMWGAPGWYEGGQPYDPLPSLLAWDKLS